MKLIYKATLDFYDEVEEKLGKGRPSYCFKEAVRHSNFNCITVNLGLVMIASFFSYFF